MHTALVAAAGGEASVAAIQALGDRGLVSAGVPRVRCCAGESGAGAPMCLSVFEAIAPVLSARAWILLWGHAVSRCGRVSS